GEDISGRSISSECFGLYPAGRFNMLPEIGVSGDPLSRADTKAPPHCLPAELSARRVHEVVCHFFAISYDMRLSMLGPFGMLVECQIAVIIINDAIAGAAECVRVSRRESVGDDDVLRVLTDYVEK